MSNLWFTTRRGLLRSGAMGGVSLWLSRFPWLRDSANAAQQRFVAISRTPADRGIWLLTERGDVISLGDAPQFDPLYPAPPVNPVPFVALAATSTGQGLCVDQRGEVLALGDAPQFDPLYPAPPVNPVPFVALAATGTGQGLWLLDQRGEVLALGDAPQFDPLYPRLRSSRFRSSR